MVSANRATIQDCARGLLLRQGRLQDTGLEARYILLGKEVWADQNFDSIKDTQRMIINVQKNMNIIHLPSYAQQFSSISVVRNGKWVPLLLNSKINKDNIDLSYKKMCECGCDLCATVKNYEIIKEEVVAPLPGGGNQTFTKLTRKKVNNDGSYVIEVTQPTVKYVDGVHTQTVMEKTEQFLCKLDIDENGCVKGTLENHEKVYANCNYDTIENDCGRPYELKDCDPDAMGYNITQEKDMIVLPSSLSYDRVLVRFYASAPAKDLTIPIVAKPNFMAKIYYESVRYDDKIPQYRIDDALKNVVRTTTDLQLDLSRLTMEETFAALNPKRI